MNSCASTMALAAALLALSHPTCAQTRPAVQLGCVAYDTGPQLECTVLVSRDAAPLSGVQVTLGATMPSMPMAHSVKPVVAAPTGSPGEYRGTLSLEMNGAWAVQVDLAGPVRDRVVRTLAVDECDGERRCPVQPVRAGTSTAGHPAATGGKKH